MRSSNEVEERERKNSQTTEPVDKREVPKLSFYIMKVLYILLKQVLLFVRQVKTQDKF